MSKTDSLSEYIKKCNEVLESNDTNSASELLEIIVAIYGIEITDLDNRLPYINSDSRSTMGNIRALMYILENHKDDLELAETKELRELEKLRLQSSISVTNNNNSNSTATSSSNTTVSISLYSTLERLQALTISQEDKEALEEKLAALQVALDSRDNDKVKLKLTNVLKYIGDKCVDAGIAVLPYLGQIAATI